ncbi:MAG: hypothetical protein K2O47_05065, partial [Muribaculaceae bacterium]|nr:hypothetical protein [Muribaculaceae bacterium]
MTDDGIEDLLSPKCEFHTSPGFMEKVLAEAGRSTSGKCKNKRILWCLRAGAVASVAVLGMVAATFFDNQERKDIHKVSDNVWLANGSERQIDVKQPVCEVNAPSNNMEDKAEHIINKKNIGQGSLMVAADAIKKESEDKKEKTEISKSEHLCSDLAEDASSYPNETSTDFRENFFAVSDEFEDYSCG